MAGSGEKMSKALELFTALPKMHNCAQAVVCGCGRSNLYDEMSANGGGRAPDGICGALYGALQLLPAEKRALAQEDFLREFGAVECVKLKQELHVPCTACVESGASLVEKYTK